MGSRICARKMSEVGQVPIPTDQGSDPTRKKFLSGKKNIPVAQTLECFISSEEDAGYIFALITNILNVKSLSNRGS
jgi:hypothetical protein